MKYILFTYDALTELTSGRLYQSSDFDNGQMLLELMLSGADKWKNGRVRAHSFKNGIILCTEHVDKRRGLIFDMETFQGFSRCPEDKRMMMLQRILKYASRYFDNQPLAKCEIEIPGKKTTIVYPFPFSANRNVDKVFIDRNSFKQDRKEKDFLTVFMFGTDETPVFSSTNAKKAVSDLKDLTIAPLHQPHNEAKPFLKITELEPFDLSIDSRMDFDSWLTYSTNSQKSFIIKEINGPERLEGAAGTGKTISMILRCVYTLKKKILEGTPYRIIFVTHSLATKERIMEVFKNVWSEFGSYFELTGKNDVSICVTTLQEWCGNHIGTFSIQSEQYLDKDAADSKLLQKMYIAEAFDRVYSNTKASLKVVCSNDFYTFLNETNKETIYDLFQQEIAVLIKGRAGQNIVKYKALVRPTYAIPLKNDADKDFVYAVYREYQNSLIKQKRYDNDDIVLSALKNLDTPIWNRLREEEGFDCCFIDETHLFNINELTIFQYLNKENVANHIIYAIDKSQSVGDWGIDENLISSALGVNSEVDNTFNVMFRNSPEIVDLAFCILSHGASLFTNFDNPLDHFEYGYTKEQEQKCTFPTYLLYPTDDSMIEGLFGLLNSYCREKSSKKSSILVTFTTEELLHTARKISDSKHIPYECLTSRCDINTVNRAVLSNKYVFAGIDYVGGLEFESVIIVGVDKGRVPPDSNENEESNHILSYAWHNRMYVAITRAKYSVTLLGNSITGGSPLLELAKMYDLLNEQIIG